MSAVDTIRVHSPGDVIALVPYLLGVEPAEALVLVGLVPSRTTEGYDRVGPVLRSDLPPPRHLDIAARELVRLLHEAGACAALGIVYPPRAGAPTDDLRDALGRAGRVHRVPFLDILRVSPAGTWRSLTCTRPDCCPPYEQPVPSAGASPVAAAAVTAGLAGPIPGAGIVARFRPPDDVDREVLTALHRDVWRGMVRGADAGEPPAGLRCESIALLGAARERFRRGDRWLEPGAAVRLVLGLRDLRVRDRVMTWDPSDDVEAHLELWASLARASLPPDSAAPLTLAAWVAWTTGRHPVARVALREALRADPGYRMAALLNVAVNSPMEGAEARRKLFPGTAA